MGDPFRIEGPALISFSGGRTSGLMLKKVMLAHGGKLPANVHIGFANTGKEREETLEFVRDVQDRWGVLIHWLERDPDGGGVREVDYATASREGEPFHALITERKFLPNPVTRYCTQELKIRVMKKWMEARGYDHWTNAVGIRADEPRRIAKHKGRTSKESFDVVLPLAVAGITVADVRAFWAAQPFDLQLRSWEGNCDLCFLKGRAKRERIMRDRPDLAAWWVQEEEEERQREWAKRKQNGAASWAFRSDTPNYKHLLRVVQASPMLFPDEPPTDLTDLGDCDCDLNAA